MYVVTYFCCFCSCVAIGSSEIWQKKSPLSSFICRTLFQTYLVMHGPKNGNEGEILIEIIIALLCHCSVPHLMLPRWPGLLPAGGTHEIFNLLYTFFFFIALFGFVINILFGLYTTCLSPGLLFACVKQFLFLSLYYVAGAPNGPPDWLPFHSSCLHFVPIKTRICALVLNEKGT